MKKRLFFISIILAGGLLASLLFYFKRELKSELYPTAIGLRGSNTVARDLNEVQQDKLKKILLDIPSLAHSPANERAPFPYSVQKAQVINQFNQEQKK